MERFWEMFFDGIPNFRWFVMRCMLVYGFCKLIVELIKCISDKLDRRGKPPIGKHFKEHPMDTVTVKFCASELEKHKDKKAGRKKEDYVPRLLVLGYGCEKEVIKSKNEAQVSRKANERLLLNFEKEVAAMLCGDIPCLFDRYGYVNEYKGEGEITDLSKHWDRSFCLGRDSKLALWLEGQEKIVNKNGEVIGVRGIDDNAIEQLLHMHGSKEFKVSEFVVPDIDEETLCKMSLTQLLIFCDLRNCKFKINNGTFPPKCHFEFSETPGYTGTEMCEKIKALAESKRYKFRIIEGEGKNAIFTDRYGSNAC